METFTPRAAGALSGSHDAPSPSLVNFLCYAVRRQEGAAALMDSPS